MIVARLRPQSALTVRPEPMPGARLRHDHNLTDGCKSDPRFGLVHDPLHFLLYWGLLLCPPS